LGRLAHLSSFLLSPVGAPPGAGKTISRTL
jgi:hypothetical protein